MKRPKVLDFASAPPGRFRFLRNLSISVLYIGLLVWVGTLIAITLIDIPKDREMTFTDQQLLERLQQFRRPSPPSLSDDEKELAEFGKKLFFHETMACQQCHDSKQPQTHTHQRSLVDLADKPEFFRDGRAFDLPQAIEKMMLETVGLGRIEIVNFVKQKYPRSYQHHFGPLPRALQQPLPETARKYESQTEVPTHIAANGLATLGDADLLMGMVDQAVKSERPPIHFLLEQTRLPVVPQHSIFAIAEYDALPMATQIAIDDLIHNTALAVAAYLKTLRTGPSRFDRFVERAVVEGNIRPAIPALYTEQELRGFYVFDEVANCSTCHRGGRFTDYEYHNIGLSSTGGKIELGRALGHVIANRECGQSRRLCEQAPTNPNRELGAFQTPSLRRLKKDRGRYFHDARSIDLPEIITFYQNAEAQPEVGYRSTLLKSIHLLPREQDDLIAFLKSLEAPLQPAALGNLSRRSDTKN